MRQNLELVERIGSGRPKQSIGPATSSDSSKGRWTVRGVPPAVSNLAVTEAASHGITVGDWLTLAIVKATSEQL